MKKWLREYRLIPVVLIATGCLFALKAIGLVFDGGYTLGERLALAGSETITITKVPATVTATMQSPASPLQMAGAQQQKSWMQEVFNYPEVTGSVTAPRNALRDAAITTGSVGAAKPAAPAAAKGELPVGQVAAPETKPAVAPPPGTSVPLDPTRPASAAERSILERLYQRRQELDARARELEVRESLLKAAEKKLEAKLVEIKEAEARITDGLKKKDDAEVAKFKGIVTMYESMKPREAAKIFDRLDGKVLVEVATQIAPRRMSEIMAQMTPEAAERLTVELASRASGTEKTSNPADLPKIEGKPTGG